jgi:hypothetical protein
VPKAAEAAFVALAFAALASATAHAQVLYKWTDADGKVQYSDHPPKKFSGTVTRIETDVAPTPAPAAKRAPAAPPAAAAAKDVVEAAAPDRATQRRTTRNELDRRVKAARANLELARKALEGAPGPEPDERQVIQQQQQAGQGGMHGLSAQRSNCRPAKDATGKAIVLCNARVPNESYFERVGKLEEAVKRAEEALAEAQEAWRRGVD